MSSDETRIDRWSYDPQGRVVWHLALNSEGQLVSDWYKLGYKSAVSSTSSLGICGSGLCITYKFDEQGSGRLEKTVQHSSGEDNLELDSEEHYNYDGVLDEKVGLTYRRDAHGNWTSRSVFAWDPISHQMIEVERDLRKIEYY